MYAAPIPPPSRPAASTIQNSRRPGFANVAEKTRRPLRANGRMNGRRSSVRLNRVPGMQSYRTTI